MRTTEKKAQANEVCANMECTKTHCYRHGRRSANGTDFNPTNKLICNEYIPRFAFNRSGGESATAFRDEKSGKIKIRLEK